MELNVSQLISPKNAWVKACTKSYFEIRSKSGSYKNLIRVVYPHADFIRIQSKVRDIALNHSGTILYVATREAVLVISVSNINHHSQSNSQITNDNVTLITKSTINIKAYKIMVHPDEHDIFILLCQDHNSETPIVRVYESKVKTRILAEWKVEDADTWYTGAWNPKNNLLIFVDRRNRVYTMTLSSHFEDSSPPTYIKTLESELYGITYSRKGDYVFFYGSEGYLECFSTTILQNSSLLEPILSTRAHSHIITSCAANRCNNLIATGGSDHTIHIFDFISNNAADTASNELVSIGTFPELEGQVSNISFSKCGLLLAWGTKDSKKFDDAEERQEDASDDFTLTIAGVKPCQIYYRQPTSSPITHCVFVPNSYIVIFVLDYDYMKKGPINAPQCPIGLLYLE